MPLAIRVGADEQPVAIAVIAGQVEPVLIGIDKGHLILGAAYAGNDQVNLALGELSGKYVAMPAFDLRDQAGKRIQCPACGRALLAPQPAAEEEQERESDWTFDNSPLAATRAQRTPCRCLGVVHP